MTSPAATLRALLAAASAAPWFNAYAGIYSKPISDRYMALEAELDAKLAAEGREAVDADFDSFPEAIVLHVPATHGDTPGSQGVADAEFVCAARNELPAVLAELELKTRLLDEATSCLMEIGAVELHAEDTVDHFRATAIRAVAAARTCLVTLGSTPGPKEGG